VLKEGFVLLPHYDIFNEQGVHVFKALDQDPAWRRRPRPKGHYVSIACVPGNFLAEGTLSVAAALVTLEPIELQYYEQDAVSFQVIDSFEGDSVRGDWGGRIGGVVRPSLQWDTQFNPNGSK
jgi:lipopolysaccharide transport system ATP-binding protein